MNNIASKLPDFAPALALLGVILLAAAWPLSQILPDDYIGFIHKANILAWILIISCFFTFLYRPLPLALLYRAILVLTVFVFTVYGMNDRHSRAFAAETLSVLGLFCFTGGALFWPEAHIYFEKTGKRLNHLTAIPPSIFVGLCSLLFLAAAVFLSWYCFAWRPAYPDSTAQYIHGKFMAAGQLYGLSPPLRDFFPVWMMVSDGKWYAQYQPLHEFLLSLGHRLQAPFLINPLGGALTLILIYALAKRVYGENTARLAAVLALGCQFMLFMSSEYMNHATALLCTTLFIFCYMEMLHALGKTPPYLWALAAGLAIGALFLTRPLSAVGVALPFIGYALYLLWHAPRSTFAPFALMAAAALVCVAFQLWFDAQTTGDMWLLPTARYHAGKTIAALGIHEDTDVWNSVFKAHGEWVRMNLSLFEWALPGGFFVALLCLLPIKELGARLMLAMAVSYTLVNMANHYASNVFGPRYLYETSSVLIILTAAGISRIPELLTRCGATLPAPNAWRGIMAIALALIFFTGFFVRFPANLHSYSNGYFDSHPDFYQSMLEQSEKPAIIFIGRTVPEDNAAKDTAVTRYRWVAFTNPPRDEADVIFAIDRGDARNIKLIERYPERHAYVEHKGQLSPALHMSAMPSSLPSLRP